MKERPILFSAAMVRAILDGRKTQTRRPMKPQPVGLPEDAYCDPYNRNFERFTFWTKDNKMILGAGGNIKNAAHWKCPFGQPGDHLWVREAWYCSADKKTLIGYVADAEHSHGQAYYKKPSIHMPRAASRITLEIVDVRVERLHEITEQDAKAEGVGGKDTVTVSPITTKTYREAFSILWDNIHVGAWKNKVHKPGNRWNDNPCVWVVTFRRVKP